MTTIVVGVDGSDGSKLALRWALDEANRTDAKVVAIATWTYPVGAVASPWMGGYDVPMDLTEPTTQALDETVAEIAGEVGFSSIASKSVSRRARRPAR